MIGILLFWLAFSPSVQPVPERPAVPHQEHLQHKKESPGHQQKSVSNTLIAENIRRYFDQQQQINHSGAPGQSAIGKQLTRFYAARRFQPVWTKPVMVSELITAVDGVVDDGLNPSDYHIGEIKGFHSHPPVTPELQARYDILLSDSFFTLASHLRFGKVDAKSLDPNWNLTNAVTYSALEYRLQNAIAKDRIAGVLKDLRPKHPKYDQLRAGLAHYREIAREGGWPAVAEGPTLTEGFMDRRIPMLRKRLEASGEIDTLDPDTTKVYSKELVDAVKRFQRQNGLDPDGLLGNATVKTMNIPVESRIDQIRINLERYRWFISDIEPTYVMVNIPDFTLQYVENSRPSWHTRVIVGQPVRETPVFKAEMQYIIFNPQWVIPPTILAKDALPGIRKSISYLSHKKLNVIDKNGSVVDPAKIKWSQYTSANFPYRLQQASGDQGSLGRIKFMLPNKHIVYLHDTPTKELFKKNTRDFSSGCIRVENPLELAGLVLQDSVKWSKERIQAAVNTKKTTTVNLPKRIPVFILYFTAVAEGDGILFRDDVYSKDNAVLNALNKPLPKF
ncbi:MAG: L,D-transpeptidase family protein [Chlorobiales bacterium]|nr:L,D-transpeptidase family protein [Chlorobiales bacterium]